MNKTIKFILSFEFEYFSTLSESQCRNNSFFTVRMAAGNSAKVVGNAVEDSIAGTVAKPSVIVFVTGCSGEVSCSLKNESVRRESVSLLPLNLSFSFSCQMPYLSE